MDCLNTVHCLDHAYGENILVNALNVHKVLKQKYPVQVDDAVFRTLFAK